VKNVNNSDEPYINFQDFLVASSKYPFTPYFYLGCLCRSTDDELDTHIFKIFDLCETEVINKEALMMMVINFPDMGFSNSQNINIPDKFYTNIKDNVVRCIQNMRIRRENSELLG